MTDVRHPAVAGLFYPDTRPALEKAVRQYLNGAAAPTTRPKALIAPHAGFVYSGPVAASAYVQLESVRSHISRVVLLGPTHRVAFRGLALSSADTFLTPFQRKANSGGPKPVQSRSTIQNGFRAW